MLKVFRNKNVTKMVLWGLLILILPAFVLWGTGADRGSSKDRGPAFVGLIDGRKVTFNDFADSIVSIKSKVIISYYDQPKVMQSFLDSKAVLGKLAWDGLLMAREARKANIKVTNDELVNFIRSQSIFLRDGAFDDRMYYYVLRNNIGLEPRAFEEIMRSELKIAKYNDLLTKDIKVPDEEIIEAYGKENNKLKISYLFFPANDFADKAKIEDSQILEYFEAHKNEFIIPAKEGSTDKAAGANAAFDDVKADIQAFMSQRRSRELAVEAAGKEHDRIADLMSTEKLTFEAAAAKLGLKITESGLFSRGESIEGIGEAGQVADAAAKLEARGEISGAVETGKGAIIFKVAGAEKYDEGKFKKDKDDYSKKIVRLKKNQFLEGRLIELNKNSRVNIDFKDYEKYYR